MAPQDFPERFLDQPTKRRLNNFCWVRLVCGFLVLLLVHARQGDAQPIVLQSDIKVWYSIGTIDPRHEITKTEVLKALKEAERMWEKPARRNLFEYSKTSPFKINILYGPLSLHEEKRREARATVDLYHLELTGAIRRLENFTNELREQSQHIQQVQRRFIRERDAYEQRVKTWNEGREPFTQKEYEALRKQREQIEAERHSINRLTDQFNQRRLGSDKLRAEVRRKEEIYERVRLSYNREYGSARSMDQGVYYGTGIDVYYFANLDELRTTLAHELGHALGIGHTDAEGSLMYPLINDINRKLDFVTDVDLRHLAMALKNPTGEARPDTSHHFKRNFLPYLPRKDDVDCHECCSVNHHHHDHHHEHEH